MKRLIAILFLVAVALTSLGSAQFIDGGHRKVFTPGGGGGCTAGSDIAICAVTGKTSAQTTSGDTQDSTNGTTLALPSIDCTGANLIVVIGTGGSAVVTSVADSSGNSYASIVTNGNMTAWYAQNATVSSTLVVTPTFASTNFRRAAAWCLSHASISAALDTSAVMTSTSGVSPVVTGNITPAAAGGIIIMMAGNDDGLSTSFTANNGFTLTFGLNGTMGGVASKDTNAMTKLGATGAQTPSMTMSATGGATRAVAVAFKK